MNKLFVLYDDENSDVFKSLTILKNNKTKINMNLDYDIELIKKSECNDNSSLFDNIDNDDILLDVPHIDGLYFNLVVFNKIIKYIFNDNEHDWFIATICVLCSNSECYMLYGDKDFDISKIYTQSEFKHKVDTLKLDNNLYNNILPIIFKKKLECNKLMFVKDNHIANIGKVIFSSDVK